MATVSVIAVMLVGCSVILAGCVFLADTFLGCTDRDERLAGDLAKLAILDQRPPDAVPVEERYSGCDTDDGFAYAGQRYRSDLKHDQIIAFYQQAVPRDGWALSAKNPPPRTDGLVVTSARLCFDKDINGITAHLSLSFPSDLNLPADAAGLPPSPSPHDVFGLDLTASHDGSAWC